MGRYWLASGPSEQAPSVGLMDTALPGTRLKPNTDASTATLQNTAL